MESLIGSEASQPLIAALLAPPRSTAKLVSRPRLNELLETAAQGPVTIVSGEPGAGKTSLATDWIASMGPDRQTAWLTLRPTLDDPITFWRYLLAAMRPLGVDLTDLSLTLADDEPPGDLWLTTLSNRLAASEKDSMIIIDDFHELESAAALGAFVTLIDQLPRNTHLVVLTRVHPAWNTPHWRMYGRATEISSRDLRYTLDEIEGLVASTGIELSDHDLFLLEQRTEGWAGGLRLALLSILDSSDPSSFIARFAADDELVSTYLFREVLERQPNDIREFLLDVSVLDPVSADLGDQLRERNDSKALLERCRDENLFLSELAAPTNTYHMHALVSQLLQATLGLEEPDRLRRLHLRASTMFEARGDITAALSHAARAQSDIRIGEVVTAHSGDFAHQGRFDEIRSWISMLRSHLSVNRPEVELGLAMALAISGRTTEALEYTDRVQASDVSHDMRYAALQGRGVALVVGGRFDELADVASELEANIPAGHNGALPFEPVRAAQHWMGISRLMAEDLAGARRALESAAACMANPDVHCVDSVSFLARVAHAEGDLAEAQRRAGEALARNEELAGGETSALTCAYVALADVAWERNELDRATAMLDRARRSVSPLMWEAILVQCSASRVLASRGEFTEARAQIVECGQTYLHPQTSPRLRALLCEQAVDLAVKAGDTDDARRWEHSFMKWSRRPLVPAVQIRLNGALDDDDIEAAINKALAKPEPLPHRIDTMLAAADVLGGHGDEARCAELVAKATQLAEQPRMVRRFLDAGPAVRTAIRKLRDTSSDGLGASIASQFFIEALAQPKSIPQNAPTESTGTQPLVDPLTPRELQVLELLIAGRSYSEIGEDLFVSRNTVKSHASHIYTKLGVPGRKRAAEVAHEIGLV